MVTPTVWQQLGAMVYTSANLSESTVQSFAEVGGSWIVTVLYGDDSAGPYNLDHLHQQQQAWGLLGIKVGGWFNGFGGDPITDARNIAAIVHEHQITLVVVDLEFAYQGSGANLMPILVRELRRLLPLPVEIGVSTNGLNSASIWNGRTLDPPMSFYDLGIRVMPQWYSAYYLKDGHTDPVYNMQWLKEQGPNDFNVRDTNAKKSGYRGVPLSYVHGTLEVTGLEGSSLAHELSRVEASRRYGYTTGISLYTLENIPQGDFALLKTVRGRLYL